MSYLEYLQLFPIRWRCLTSLKSFQLKSNISFLLNFKHVFTLWVIPTEWLSVDGWRQYIDETKNKERAEPLGNVAFIRG